MEQRHGSNIYRSLLCKATRTGKSRAYDTEDNNPEDSEREILTCVKADTELKEIAATSQNSPNIYRIL